jgi:hypothetical protein
MHKFRFSGFHIVIEKWVSFACRSKTEAFEVFCNKTVSAIFVFDLE